MNYQRTEKKSHDTPQKEARLIQILQGVRGCVVAFSGGLDSSFLAHMARKHVPGRVVCVTVSDPTAPRADMERAICLAKNEGVEHIVLRSSILEDVLENGPERCYFCKTHLFKRLGGIAERENLALLDGENASDASDTRPGRRAAMENNVMSPLAMAGLTKDEIRVLAEKEGLPDPYRPPSACLASRIPTGTLISEDILMRIDRTEEALRQKGLGMVRARAEGNGVRIELSRGEMTPDIFLLLKDMETEVKKEGWAWVALDLGGYVPAGQRGV